MFNRGCKSFLKTGLSWNLDVDHLNGRCSRSHFNCFLFDVRADCLWELKKSELDRIVDKKGYSTAFPAFPGLVFCYQRDAHGDIHGVAEDRFLDSCDLHISVSNELDNRIHFRFEAICIEFEDCEGLVTIDVLVCLLIFFVLLDSNLLLGSIKILLGW